MGLFDIFKGNKDKDKHRGKDASDKSTSASAPHLPRQFYSLKVSDIVRETTDAISIYFEIPTEYKSVFVYEAGQYVTLRITIGDSYYLRSYSLSSSPDTDAEFRVAVKRKQGGKVSNFLVDKCRVGNYLDVFPPLGSFTPDLANPSPNYFLFAGGSGITPLLSIAKTLLARTSSHVTIWYANRNADHIIYECELTRLVQENKQKLTIHHILDEAPEEWNGMYGIMQASDYANALRNFSSEQLNNAHYFVCGPTGMMQTVEKALKQELGISPQKIAIEYFDIAKQIEHDRAELDAELKSEVPTSDKETIAEVSLDGRIHQVKIFPNETILTACLDAGLDAPFMCEAGVCASCRARVTQGKVTMEACYALTQKDIDEGYILTCQAYVQSPKVSLKFQ